MEEGRLANKVTVITGGGNGIGRATALLFAKEGASIVVADIQEDKAEETSQMIIDSGGQSIPIRVDVTSGADNERMANLAVDSFGGLDCLVTAAGISHANYVSGDIEPDIKNVVTNRADYLERPGWEFVEGDPDHFDKVLAVNLKGTLLGMQACVARMLGPVGIRVNSIGPGFINTHMTAIIDFMDEVETAAFNAMIPLGRRGEPAEIASAALFLCSDESSYFTGEILHPDGGFFTE